MLDWLRGGDDGSDGGDGVGEDLLEDAEWEGDDLGDGMGDDGLGDDLEFDEFGGGDEDGELDELMNRVDAFEEEVGTMSSTVNTIKHENSEMGEDLTEMKDNIRKLLEIYEMVTRGVNPFADDDPFASGASESSFDLFGDGDAGAEDGGDEFDDADALLDDEFDDMDGFELDDEPDAGAEETGEARSFEELKEEYESGDANWDEDEETEDQVAAESTDEPVDTDDEVLEEIDEPDDVDDEPALEMPMEDTDDSTTTYDDPRIGTSGYDAPAGGEPTAGVLGEKPYLRHLPEGYTTDLVIMRWLSKLDEYSEDESAADTVEYYRAIGWISNDVATELQSYAPGLSTVDLEEEPMPSSTLPFEAHQRSLRYIHHLATTRSRRVVLTESSEFLEDVLELDPGTMEDLTGNSAQMARTDGGGFWAGIEGFDLPFGAHEDR